MIHDAPHWQAKAERLERELDELATAGRALLAKLDIGAYSGPERAALRAALDALPETTKGEA